MYELEHEFIADSDARNVARAVCVDRVHNRLALAQVCSAVVVWIVIIAQPDRHIYFCLFNRLELRTRGLLM